MSKFLLWSSERDSLAGWVTGRHLDVDASLRENLVDAVSLGPDDVTVLRLFHLDGDLRHLSLLHIKTLPIYFERIMLTLDKNLVHIVPKESTANLLNV